MTDELPPQSELILYQTEDGRTRLECRLEADTVWLTQVQLAELFETSVPNINQHLKSIYEEGELDEQATIKPYLMVRTEGPRRVQRSVLHYSLPAIFALASDYRESDREAQVFFAKMQNKMHYAATGFTAAEIVHQRADAMKPNMGRTSWSGDRVLKRDVVTAKNYLDDKEIDTLNRIVVMFLDRAEFRALRRKDIKMADWEHDLEKFLADTELPVLATAGSISHELATSWASEQYDAFAERRRIEAETKAEAKYLEDLTATAKLLEGQSAKPAAPKVPKRRKKS